MCCFSVSSGIVSQSKFYRSIKWTEGSSLDKKIEQNQNPKPPFFFMWIFQISSKPQKTLIFREIFPIKKCQKRAKMGIGDLGTQKTVVFEVKKLEGSV